MGEVREVDLLHYLPQFIQEYLEMKKIMQTEDPEFQLVVNEGERIKDNQFIISCDEVGIARFESILNITPSVDDTLEARISRVLIRWNDYVPYTYKVLLQKLMELCGNNFTASPDWNNYTLTIITHLAISGQVDELDNLLKSIIPCNILVNCQNELEQASLAVGYHGASVVTTKHLFINTKSNTEYSITGHAYTKNNVSVTRHVTIN